MLLHTNLMFNFPTGYTGIVICLDGSPDFLKMYLPKFRDDSDKEIENNLILHILNMSAPLKNVTDIHSNNLKNTMSLEDRIASANKLFPVQLKYSGKFLAEVTMAACDRIKAIANYKSISRKLKSPIILLRQKEIPTQLVYDEDYGLNKYTEAAVTVHKFDNDHDTIMENVECANVINKAVRTYREDRAKFALSERTDSWRPTRQNALR